MIFIVKFASVKKNAGAISSTHFLPFISDCRLKLAWPTATILENNCMQVKFLTWANLLPVMLHVYILLLVI